MLVLEFMEGGDMWSALRGPHREELQWYGRGRSLALDIARGLHFLHEHKAGPRLQTPQALLIQTDWAPFLRFAQSAGSPWALLSFGGLF